MKPRFTINNAITTALTRIEQPATFRRLAGGHAAASPGFGNAFFDTHFEVGCATEKWRIARGPFGMARTESVPAANNFWQS